MSMHWKNRGKAKVRVAKRDAMQEQRFLLLFLVSGGVLVATLTLGKLLLMSP